jgi:hypothetical protein
LQLFNFEFWESTRGVAKHHVLANLGLTFCHEVEVYTEIAHNARRSVDINVRALLDSQGALHSGAFENIKTLIWKSLSRPLPNGKYLPLPVWIVPEILDDTVRHIINQRLISAVLDNSGKPVENGKLSFRNLAPLAESPATGSLLK